nr:MAG TPA: hypothetical protein [Bacteriophage sp.]
MHISYITNCYLSYRYICSNHWEGRAPDGSIRCGLGFKIPRWGS